MTETNIEKQYSPSIRVSNNKADTISPIAVAAVPLCTTAAGDENVVLKRAKEDITPKSSTSGNANISVSPAQQRALTSLHYHSWIEQFAMKHFLCGLCKSIFAEPKMIVSGSSPACVCAKCAVANNLDVVDAPIAFVNAASEIKAFLLNHSISEADNTTKVCKNFIRAVKTVNPKSMRNTTTFSACPATTELEESDGKFQGVNLNPNTDPPQHYDASTEAKESPGRILFKNVESPKLNKVPQIHPEHLQQLDHLMSEEMNRRAVIHEEQSVLWLETQNHWAMRLKSLKAQRRGCSKQLKMEADDNYERANYTLAINLYTKAIANVHDGTTKINVLYGNRSAALFMATQYEGCIEDCLKVCQREPQNVKLYSRAIKAAVMMGNLEKALAIHSKIDPSIVTPQMEAERAKIFKALDELKEAKLKHGTLEGDRIWEMLMTKFAETTVFRMNLADSMAAQGRFDKAIDLLSVITAPSRPPPIAYRIAKYRYMSGFEHFENARATLEPYISDPQCAALLDLLNSVDDAKQQGNSLFSNKNFAASVDCYTKAIELDLTNGRILRILYCNRAAAYKELNRLQEGVDDCSKAIELDPNFSKAYARRARCLMLQKNFDCAVRDFAHAVQCDPEDKELHRELKSAEEALAREIEKEKDLYYVLDVDQRTTDTEIKAKYRALCLKWHPDKCAGKADIIKVVAERKFKAINEAYSTLTNPEKRREYDAKRERERFTTRSGFENFVNRQGAANAAKNARTRHHTQPGNAYGTSYNHFW